MTQRLAALIGAFLIASPTVARSEAAISFIPEPGYSSVCSGQNNKRITQGAFDQTYPESWSRRLSIRDAADGVVFDLGVTLHLTKDTSTSFSQTMSRSAPTPIDPETVSDNRIRVAVFAASFPEHFLYGRTLTPGAPVRPLPDFRSDYSAEMVDSGFVQQTLERDLVFAREEPLDGAPTYVFEGSFLQDVRFNDGARNRDASTATFWIDQATLLLRRAQIKRNLNSATPQSPNDLIHKIDFEWRCTIEQS